MVTSLGEGARETEQGWRAGTGGQREVSSHILLLNRETTGANNILCISQKLKGKIV